MILGLIHLQGATSRGRGSQARSPFVMGAPLHRVGPPRTVRETPAWFRSLAHPAVLVPRLRLGTPCPHGLLSVRVRAIPSQGSCPHHTPIFLGVDRPQSGGLFGGTRFFLSALLGVLLVAPTPAWAAQSEARADPILERLERDVKRRPNDPALQYNLGTVLHEKGEYERSAQALNKALASGDVSLQGNISYNLGNTLYRLGRPKEETAPAEAIRFYEQALGDYQMATHQNPKDQDAQYNYELVEHRLKKLKEKEQEKQQESKGQSQKSDQKKAESQEQKQGQEEKQKQEKEEKKPSEGKKGEPASKEEVSKQEATLPPKQPEDRAKEKGVGEDW